MRTFQFFLVLAVLLVTGLTIPATPASATLPADPTCMAPDNDPDPPVYYAIDLVTTRKVPGARLATGTGNVTFAHSPFGVALTPEGEYAYSLAISMEKVRLKEGQVLDAWVTTPSLDQVVHIGRLNASLATSGNVAWNKFLVVISLEDADSEPGARWTGPIVARGMSRSGLMHTMAGHGPFQTEPCSVYGYR